MTLSVQLSQPVRPSVIVADSRSQAHARLLRDWMADKGLKAPSLALSVEKQGQQISPDYIRKLVRGERELSGMPLELREAVRRALRVPSEEWEATTGLATAADIDPDPIPVVRSRLRDLPPALQRMIDTKGHLDDALQQERWQQYLAGQRFASGEITAERYWNLFLVLKNAGVEPGGN